jgi:hypothetical protein
MFTFIGILLILFAIGMAVFTNVVNLRREDTQEPNGYGGQRTVRAHSKFLTGWNWKKTVGLSFLGLLLTTISGMFFYNPAGTATSVQYLWGGDEAVTSQGLKMKLWGKTIPISFEIAMQDFIPKRDTEGNLVNPNKEEGIYYRQAQRMEFADAIKADIATSLVVSVNYEDEETFLSMADKNRSEAKLVYARVYPVYDQALKNTCKLMDAQDYISGASSTFDFYLKDQMENGMYRVKEVTTTVEESPITPNDSNRTVVKNKVASKTKTEKKYVIIYENGQPVRDASNSLKRYGLKVEQAAVTNIDWEEEFDKRLQLQKEQVAQTQLEKQEAEKEYYATQKAIAKGEREKAEVKVKLEKAQLEKTIAAETRAKEASYKEKEESNLLAAAKKQALRIRVTADADAYEIRKKVNAGITPEKRLQMELDASVDRTKALAGPNGLQLPSQYLSGGGKGGSSKDDMLMLIITQMMQQNKVGKQ